MFKYLQWKNKHRAREVNLFKKKKCKNKKINTSIILKLQSLIYFI